MLPRSPYTRICFCPRCDFANKSIDEYCIQCRVRLHPTEITRIYPRKPGWGRKLILISGCVLVVVSLCVLALMINQHRHIVP